MKEQGETQHFEANEPLEEKDPNGLAANAPGAKLDAGKAPIWEYFFEAFPRSMELLAQIGIQGNEKYSKNGWHHVPDGFNRYSNAMGRHQIAEAKGEVFDEKSGNLHAGHTAWNAMARLERMLMDNSYFGQVKYTATERHVSGRNDLSGVFGSSPDRADERTFPHSWEKSLTKDGNAKYSCQKCGETKYYTDPAWRPPEEGCTVDNAFTDPVYRTIAYPGEKCPAAPGVHEMEEDPKRAGGSRCKTCFRPGEPF
jgi:hypothetical protein